MQLKNDGMNVEGNQSVDETLLQVFKPEVELNNAQLPQTTEGWRYFMVDAIWALGFLWGAPVTVSISLEKPNVSVVESNSTFRFEDIENSLFKSLRLIRGHVPNDIPFPRHPELSHSFLYNHQEFRCGAAPSNFHEKFQILRKVKPILSRLKLLDPEVKRWENLTNI